MPQISRRWLILAFLTVFGCDSDSLVEPPPQIRVQIVDETGKPVKGATIEGGFDWTWFRVQTNDRGEASVPKGERGTVFKTNYFPLMIPGLGQERYSIRTTPKTTKPIGEVRETPIVFNSTSIATFGYDGTYRLYNYNSNEVTEVFSTTLIPLFKQHAMAEDVMWFTTHDAGVYSYSLANLGAPAETGHWDFSRNLVAFAVDGNLLALPEGWGAGPLALYSLNSDGTYEKLSELRHFHIRELHFRGHYLVALGFRSLLVFDVSDPRDLKLVYNGLQYEGGVFFGDKVVLGPVTSNASGFHEYDVLDISDPGNPHLVSKLQTDSQLIHVQSDQGAIGRYYFHRESVSILEGSVESVLNTVGIVAGVGSYTSVAANGDYYLIGGQLVLLSD